MRRDPASAAGLPLRLARGQDAATLWSRYTAASSMAWLAAIEAREPAVGIYDSVSSDTVACRLGVSCIGHLVHAHSARGGLVHREGIPGELPAPVGACHRIAGAFDLRQSACDILASSPVAAARTHSGWAASLCRICANFIDAL